MSFVLDLRPAPIALGPEADGHGTSRASVQRAGPDVGAASAPRDHVPDPPALVGHGIYCLKGLGSPITSGEIEVLPPSTPCGRLPAAATAVMTDASTYVSFGTERRPDVAGCSAAPHHCRLSLSLSLSLAAPHRRECPIEVKTILSVHCLGTVTCSPPQRGRSSLSGTDLRALFWLGGMPH